MSQRNACLRDGIFAIVAFIWLSSTVSIQMSGQFFVWKDVRSHLVHLFGFSPVCFSNVSSNGMTERMQSHTSCICSTFLHCTFSKVSSNCLPERRQIRIGCIFGISPLHRSGLCICRWIFMWKAFSWRFFFKCTVKLAAFKLLKEHSPLRCIFFFHILAYYSILGIVESEALTVLRLITFLSSWSRRARIFCPQNAFLRKYFITWVAFYRILGSDLWVWLSVSN